MPTAAERRALLFFASVALLGAGWRTVRATSLLPPTDAQRSALDRQIAAVDSAREGKRLARGGGRASGRPGRNRAAGPAPSSAALTDRLIDVDRATADELEMLPRIGPSLARRIVADRDSLGPFGSLESLQRVKGIGAVMAREIAPRITFSASIDSRPAGGPSGSRAASSQRAPPDANPAAAPPARRSTATRPRPLWAGQPP